MPRPLRVEYEHAFYHVLNRAYAGCSIFPEDKYYQSFLEILGEACARFDCLIHAYCLMNCQFHLIIETPKANLSRIMRQINGVYTMHYNAAMNFDGPLFKGRFKAVPFDPDGYLLKLTRFIHCRPIDVKKPHIKQLNAYQWSSYPAYTGEAKPLPWLAQDLTVEALAQECRHRTYADYVMAGVDDETAQIYSKSRLPRAIGDERFKQWVREQLSSAASNKPVIQSTITMMQVIDVVSDFYGLRQDEITQMVRGRQAENEARKVAMYLCQQVLDATLSDIANQFHLSNRGSTTTTIHQVRIRAKEDSQFKQKLGTITDKIKRQSGFNA
jgi:REP element-mobilizing transposase RayT